MSTTGKVEIVGLTAAVNKLNKEIKSIEKGTEAGLFAATVDIMNDADNIIPIKDGILRNSAFNKLFGKSLGKVSRIIGYTAKYAGIVHEMPIGTNWSRPSAKRKWFERTIFKHIKTGRTLKTIRKFARLKK